VQRVTASLAEAAAWAASEASRASAGPVHSGPSQTLTAPGGHAPEQPTLRAGARSFTAVSRRSAPFRQQRFPVQTVTSPVERVRQTNAIHHFQERDALDMAT